MFVLYVCISLVEARCGKLSYCRSTATQKPFRCAETISVNIHNTWIIKRKFTKWSIFQKQKKTPLRLKTFSLVFSSTITHRQSCKNMTQGWKLCHEKCVYYQALATWNREFPDFTNDKVPHFGDEHIYILLCNVMSLSTIYEYIYFLRSIGIIYWPKHWSIVSF